MMLLTFWGKVGAEMIKTADVLVMLTLDFTVNHEKNLHSRNLRH